MRYHGLAPWSSHLLHAELRDSRRLHCREFGHAGQPCELIFAVAAWREAVYFTDA